MNAFLKLLKQCALCFNNFRNAFIHLAENLVALRFIILDKISAHPKSVASFAKWLRLQAQFRLDDCADHQSAILGTTSKDAPHIHNAARGTVEQSQIRRGKVDVVDLSILNITHTLVVSYG